MKWCGLSVITCLFVDAQHRDPDACAPRRDLRHIVDQGFQPRAPSVLRSQLEYHAQVLREFAQPSHVLLDKLGGPVVVVEDGEDPVDDGVVGLSDSYV